MCPVISVSSVPPSTGSANVPWHTIGSPSPTFSPNVLKYELITAGAQFIVQTQKTTPLPYLGGQLPWEDLLRIAEELDTEGAFGPDGWYLAHNDFFPRNIITDIDVDGNAKITAVIDWDMCSHLFW